MQIKKITLFRINKPSVFENDINKELQFLANSLGLFSLRDKEKSLFRIFIELVKASKEGRAVSSDELAYQLNLSRGTVVHHLNKLIMADIAEREKDGYMLKERSLRNIVLNIKKEACDILEVLEEVAESIDSKI